METNKIIILEALPTSTGKVHQGDYVVSGGGIAPTIRARDYKDPIRVLVTKKESSDYEKSKQT